MEDDGQGDGDSQQRHVAAEVAGIGGLAQEIGDHGAGEDAGQVHEAIAGGAVARRDELAEDRHVVGVEHAEADAEEDGAAHDGRQPLSEAEQQAGLQAKRVVIGIAGELVKGVTNTIRYRRPQADRPLDTAEMEFIIEKVQERAQAKAQKQISLETGNADVEIKLVNSALVSIHIDGYKVSNPISFQGHDVAVQIYTAFAPMVHIGALERDAEE